MVKGVIIGLMIGMMASSSWANDSIPVETIVLEAQGESLEGQVAVGEVIRNRAKGGRRSVEEVCLAPYQFSCWNDRQRARNRLNGVSGEVVQRAWMAWEMSGDYHRGFTHYHRYDIMPYWAKGHEGIRIGNHVFYKGIN